MTAAPDHDTAVAIVPLRDDLIDNVITAAHGIWHAAYDDLLPAGQVDYMLAGRATRDVLAGYLTTSGVWFDVAVTEGATAGAVVGYCSAREYGPGTVRLEQLYVAPQRWGSGLADDLLAAVIAHARSVAATVVDLTVNKGNTRALSYYRRRGFAATGSVVTDIGGGYVMDDYVLSLQLPGHDGAE